MLVAQAGQPGARALDAGASGSDSHSITSQPHGPSPARLQGKRLAGWLALESVLAQAALVPPPHPRQRRPPWQEASPAVGLAQERLGPRNALWSGGCPVRAPGWRA